MTNVDLKNPFDVTQTEYFNSNYPLIAEYFEEPAFYKDLVERERFIIVGSRGTGKTMILKSLYLPAFVSTLRKKGIDFTSFNPKFIGVYVPCDNLDLQKYLSEAYEKYFEKGDKERGHIVWRRYLCHYLATYIVKQILATIVNYGEMIGLDLSKTAELTQAIVQKFDIAGQIKSEWPTKFDALPNFFENEKKNFLDMVMNQIQGIENSFQRPLVDLSFIKEICDILTNHFTTINDCRFYILLDDFFPPFVTFKQQSVLLDLIRERGGPLSFKITTIPEGMTYITDSGYSMRPDLDYSQKFLEYSNVGRNSDYWNLAKEVTNKRLETSGCVYSDIFEENNQTSEDFLLRLRGDVAKGHDRPIYAGFDMIVEMSSGIMGTYLLLVREMVNLRLQKKPDAKLFRELIPIPCSIQDAVVRNRSDLFLGAIAGLENGQSLYKLVTLMARQSRKRFLDNKKAKENIQFKIKHYEELLTGERKAHAKLVVAFRNNVLHSPDWHPTDRQQTVVLRTLILNRLLTPVLKIPYRDRWTVDIEANEISRILLSDVCEPELITTKPPISSVPPKIQLKIGEPVIRSTCSIFFGSYCLNAKDIAKSSKGLFLAIPFRQDWHKHTEKLIKKKFGEDAITSLDESPNGDFTCKICEWISRKEFGIYEISVLNENVIFEMGLSLGKGKPTYAVWNTEEWAKSWKKEAPVSYLIDGFEGFPYEVTEHDGIEALLNKIQGSQDNAPWNKEAINNLNEENQIFLCLPTKSHYYNSTLREEALKAIDEVGLGRENVLKLPADFKEGLTLMNTFASILRSRYCIVDSTQMPRYRENPEMFADYLWRLFSLGVAVGLKKPLIHIFNSNYMEDVASDIRGKCTFCYKDDELYEKLLSSLKEAKWVWK